MKRLLFFALSLVTGLAALRGQCPGRDLLEQKIQGCLKYPPGSLPAQPFNELKQLEARLDRCGPDRDTALVRIRQHIGKIYLRQKQFSEAIRSIKKSNKLIAEQHVTTHNDPTLRLVNYLILSSCYEGLHMREEKMAFFDSCITTYTGFRNQQNRESYIQYILSALSKKSESLLDVGDYKLCYETAVKGEKMNRGYLTDKADSLTYSVMFLTFQVNALLATKDYVRAETLLQHQAYNVQKYRSYGSLGTIYDLLGRTQIGRNNIPQATASFLRSVENDRKGGRLIACMESYVNMGFLVYDQAYHDTRMARGCYRKALACYQAEPNKPAGSYMEALNLQANIAHLFVQEKAYDSAFLYFQHAFDQLQPGLQEAGVLDLPLENIPKIEYLTALLTDKADAYFERYKLLNNSADLQKALDVYRITDQVLDKLRVVQSDIQSKLFWRKDNHRLYEHAIEACFRAKQQTDAAFYFFEKSRSVLLNDQLTEQMFLDDKDFYQQAFLVNRSLELQKGLNRTDVRLPAYDSLDNEQMLCQQQLEQLQKKNKAKNADAYKKLFDSSQVTILNVRKKILKDHQALVELFEGDEAIYEMLITRKESRLVKIDKTCFDTTLNQYLRYLSENRSLNRYAAAYHHVAHELYKLLFKDLPLPKGRIIISTEGQYFPFESLVTVNDQKDPTYFLNDHAVSYTYSARYLLISANKVRSGAGTKTFLGMAPVEYPYDTTLSSLQESVGSLKNMLGFVPSSEQLLYANATKKNFRQNFYKYKINLLYTHASDSGSQGEPVIYFADGPMALSDLVADTKPDTELIIASACKTGLGKLYRGEGVYNFSRGFASVGIPACVNNLWSVEEASANRLTELLCKYVVAGEPTDVALQKAKLEFLHSSKDNRQHPYFWAASILSGKTGVIRCEEETSWKAILIVSLIAATALMGGSVFFYSYRKKRSARSRADSGREPEHM